MWGEGTKWRQVQLSEDGKGGRQDGYYLWHHELCGSEGVLHPHLLTALLLKTVLTWARSTSASLIPSLGPRHPFRKKSAMPQLSRSIKEWNFEQQLPRGTPALGPLVPGNRAHNPFRHLKMKYQLTLSIFGQHWRNKRDGNRTEISEDVDYVRSWETSTPKQHASFSVITVLLLYLVSRTSVRPAWWKTSWMDTSSWWQQENTTPSHTCGGARVYEEKASVNFFRSTGSHENSLNPLTPYTHFTPVKQSIDCAFVFPTSHSCIGAML